MELKLTIPDYLSIKDYKKVTSLDHLSDLEKMVATVSILSNLSEDKLRELQSNDLSKVFTEVTNRLIEVNPEFYPIIEIEGKLYGYQHISKLTLGEYIDLENLCKEPIANLEHIMGILYRPVLKHSFKSIKWASKMGFKIGMGEIDDLSKYYTLEKYDSEKRYDNAEVLKMLPVSYALGALSFFLQVGNSFLLGSKTYFKLKSKKEKKKFLKETLQTTSIPTGDGLLRFITSLQHPSLTSREITLSQI